MNEPEELEKSSTIGTEGHAPAVSSVVVSLYALGMAGAASLLMAGCSLLALTAGWDAGTWSAVALVVVGSLAAGLAFAGRLAAARPGMVLGLAAAATGLSALLAAVIHPGARLLHRALWPLLGGAAAGGWLFDLGLAATLFLLPTLCFAAMPEAFRRLLGDDRAEVRGYALGAGFAGLAFGTALAGIVLLPVLGLRGTLFLAVALLGLSGGGLVLNDRSGRAARRTAGAGSAEADLPRSATPPADAPIGAREHSGSPGGILTALLLGLAGWGGIVCWSRVIGLIAGPTGPSEATAVTVYLLGLGLGAFAVSALRFDRPAIALSATLAAAGAIVAATSFLVTPVAVLYLELISPAPSTGLFSFAGALTALMLIFPFAVALGAALTLFPAAIDGGPIRQELFRAGPCAVALLLGVISGDLLFRLLLVPQYGLRRALTAAASAAVLAAIVALRSQGGTGADHRATGTLTLAGLLLLVAAFPAGWDPQVVVSAPYRYGARGVERTGSVEEYLAARHTTTPVYYREGMNATVMAEMRLQSGAAGQPIEALQLTVDGRVVAGNLADLRTQILQAHLPMLLHGEARSILLAGYATGVTAGSLLTYPIESILVVEEEEAMFGVEPLFESYSNSPLADPRLSRAVASPRAWLAADRRQYDAILLTAPAPWLPSDAALVTLEGYGQMKARLLPGGLVAQRITLSAVNAIGTGSILRTFAAAFEEVLLLQISPEDLLLIGASVPLRFDYERIRGDVAARDAVVGDLSRALSVGVNELLMSVRLDGEALRGLVGGGPLNRDDRSATALEALRDMRIHDGTVLLGAINEAGRAAPLDVLVDYGEGTQSEVDFLYSLAKSYLGLAADPERAEVIASRLAGLGEDGRAAWIRGEAAMQKADFDAALREWEGILESDPDFLDALFSLGVFYLDRRDHFAAERYLSQAARLHPEASIVLYHHGRNLFYLERYEEAIDTLDMARGASGSPDRYPLIDYLIGVSSLRLEQLDEAERSLRAYLDWAYAQDNLTVLEAEAHDRLAEVLELKGDVMKARDERRKGLNLRIEMREFARRQSEAGGSPAMGGLALPNPGPGRSDVDSPDAAPPADPGSAEQADDP